MRFQNESASFRKRVCINCVKLKKQTKHIITVCIQSKPLLRGGHFSKITNPPSKVWRSIPAKIQGLISKFLLCISLSSYSIRYCFSLRNMSASNCKFNTLILKIRVLRLPFKFHIVHSCFGYTSKRHYTFDFCFQYSCFELNFTHQWFRMTLKNAVINNGGLKQYASFKSNNCK